MIITVRVNTRAKRNAVEQIGKTEYKVWVTVVPEQGKANKKIITLLAEFFGIPKTTIRLRSGASSKMKTFELLVH